MTEQPPDSSFRAVFIAVVVGASLIAAALILHSRRPDVELEQPTADHVRATGKCASCHRRETAAVVAQYEQSRHAESGISCLDCHAPRQGQEEQDHKGFVIATALTAKNCAQCHATEYEQYERSRHAAPAWAAVRGREPFTEQQVAHAEEFHPGAVDRPPNALAALEGEAAIEGGCEGCHSVGQPNADGSIGTCTACHARHQASVALARQPATCGQCHMGPDHSQIEIYNESKHGVLFRAQRGSMNLDAPPKKLTAADMPIPTCATCHMSGIEGAKVTHAVGERLSYWLFAPISEKRPGYARAQAEMKGICLTCHTESHVSSFYDTAEAVLTATNDKVAAAEEIMAGLREDGLLTDAPFDEVIEFIYFDYWHYFGRTAKHGAFMGGPDYVQWHGNYELLAKLVELREHARELRQEHGED